MARFTLIPTILALAVKLKDTIVGYAPTLQKYMGEGLYTVCVLLCDICIIVATIINTQQPADTAWTDFNKVEVLSSSQINTVAAAVNKFASSNGLAVWTP